jgi:putative ABC transport system permease protein
VHLRLHTIALRDLRRRKSRAAFLVAGLLVGIATVVTLLTLSSALTVKAQDNLESYGANIVVRPKADTLSVGGGGLSGVAVGEREISEADLARIQTIPNRRNIAAIAPELIGSVQARGTQALLMGVHPDDQFALKRWWSLDGRRPTGADEVVAGSAAAKALHIAKGDRVAIDGRSFTVTGLLRPTGSEDDNLLITRLATAQALLHKPGKVTMVEVAALCSNCPVGKIVTQLSGVLPGTRVTALQQVMKNRMHALDQFRRFSYMVAAVIVAIEALVVFVTMMGSVNSRTREIGIFRALGFRRGHVTGLVLIEAGLASLVAGVLGYLAGMGLSYALLPLLGGGGAPVAWTPALAAGAVGLAVLVGAAASLYPALHASRMDPTVALRAL